MQSSASETEICSVTPAQSHGSNGHPAGAELFAILDTLDVPLVVVGRDGKVSRLNQVATDVLGLRPSDIGQLPSNIPRLNELKEIEKVSAEAMTHGTACQREIRNGDRWYLLRAAPYKGTSGEIESAVLTFTNVTAFRASIAQAIYEREYTKTILNTVAQPLVVLDIDLRVQTGNRAFYAMFGVSREATKGIPLFNLGNHKWKALTLWKSLTANFLDNSEFKTVEVQGDFPVIGRRTVLFDACRLGRNGEAMILVGMRDITERKRQEEKLESVVAERTAALRETVGELEAFSYSIAHDMRAPLRGMQGFAKLLSQEHASQLDAEGMDYLRRIMGSASRLDRLIQDVLNYSKIIKAQIVVGELDLDRLTRDII
jgi:two-component system CheB/CheR fusion protein